MFSNAERIFLSGTNSTQHDKQSVCVGGSVEKRYVESSVGSEVMLAGMSAG
jgi:hypothetical protein